MEPEEFLDRDSFEALSESERATYIERFMETFNPILESGKTSERTIDYLVHYFDVSEWVLRPKWSRGDLDNRSGTWLGNKPSIFETRLNTPRMIHTRRRPSARSFKND